MTNSPLAFENQKALPACPAIETAPRSLTDTPKIFARPWVRSASSSENVEPRIAFGERPSVDAIFCVGSTSLARSTLLPGVRMRYAGSSML